MSFLEKPTTRLTTLAISAWAICEVSKLAFTKEARSEVFQRDNCCQLIDCKSTQSLTIHHLIPDSFSNHSYGESSHLGSSGIYVDHFRHLKKLFVNEFDLDDLYRFNTQLKQVLSLPVNAVALCKAHHTQLHRDKLNSGLLLDTSSDHPQRPISLDTVYLNSFLYQHILPLIDLYPPDH